MCLYFYVCFMFYFRFCLYFYFFKQKTAYEMRISDWSSDVCSSDLFGLAILALTVVIKLIFFPLANKSYKSMAKMRMLQPKMMELRERYGEDKQRLNQEMMTLYKKEGANPLSGCLPIDRKSVV